MTCDNTRSNFLILMLIWCVGTMTVGLGTFTKMGVSKRIFHLRPASLRSHIGTSINTTIITHADRPYSNCTGSASERRALASLGDTATARDWQDMASCLLQRRQSLRAHLFLHVSKSGGTSICEFIKQQEQQACFAKQHQDDHCQIGPPMDTFPRWMHDAPQHFAMPHWMPVGSTSSSGTNTNATQQSAASDPTCTDMRRYVTHKHIKFLMTEHYLPHNQATGGGTACTDAFWTSLIVRDPIDRLVSHYNHMRRACRKETDPSSVCDAALLNQHDKHYWNVTRMKQHFHLITDNYYVRSLSDKTVFQDKRDIGNDEVLLQRALTVLRSMDWILSLTDRKAMALILHKGLGLKGPLQHSNTNRGERKDVTPDDARLLRRWNRADYVLYQEALRLNRLDVVSIENLQRYAPEALKANGSSGMKNDTMCCGVVC